MIYSDTSIQPHLEQLFTGVGQVLVQHWPYTFAGLDPIVQPERQLQPVVLRPGLFNANAIESIASAMEISTIDGERHLALTSWLDGVLWSCGLHNTQYIQTDDHALKTSSERRDLATDTFEHLDPRARPLQLRVLQGELRP